MKHYTMLTIVGKGQSENVMAHARAAGARGGTIVSGRGTATNALLAALGLGDSHKEILVNVIDAEDEERIMNSITGAKAKGVTLVLDCCWPGRGDNEEEENCLMNTSWEMIQVIIPAGMSEDVMAIARHAGAKGGTVLNARGTSTEDDVRFFGAPLVPEKEILMIVIEKDRSKPVLDAITSMDILKQKGTGIVFTIPVRDFRNLG